MRYGLSITFPLEKYLGEEFKFSTAKFTVEDGNSKEEVEQELSKWSKDYIKRLIIKNNK